MAGQRALQFAMAATEDSPPSMMTPVRERICAGNTARMVFNIHATMGVRERREFADGMLAFRWEEVQALCARVEHSCGKRHARDAPDALIQRCGALASQVEKELQVLSIGLDPVDRSSAAAAARDIPAAAAEAPQQAPEQRPERRRDPADGRVYTEREFRAYYGGTKEWDAARTVGAASQEREGVASAEPPPAPEIPMPPRGEWDNPEVMLRPFVDAWTDLRRRLTGMLSCVRERAERDGEELRVDAADGKGRPRPSFERRYGAEWEQQWEKAERVVHCPLCQRSYKKGDMAAHFERCAARDGAIPGPGEPGAPADGAAAPAPAAPAPAPAAGRGPAAEAAGEAPPLATP